MTTEYEDRILDVCLDEVLGGQVPPDLSARIMQALVAGNGHSASGVATSSEPAAPPVHDLSAAPASADPVVAVVHRRPQRRTANGWATVLLAASVLAAGTVIGFVALNSSNDDSGGIVENDPSHVTVPVAVPDAPVVPKDDDPAVDPPTDVPGPVVPERKFADNTPFGPNREMKVVGFQPPSDEQKPAAKYDADVIAFVNTQLRETWQRNNVTPTESINDEELCDRIYAHFLGRSPTVEESQQYVRNESSSKRLDLVNQLLSDEMYVDELAAHWAKVWADELIGTVAGGRENLANREGLEQYLRRSLQSEKRFDQIAFELIAATGSNKPGAEDYNGAVNFMLSSLGKDAVGATAHVARTFLGKQMDCVQCHDSHAGQQIAQRHFWQLNSFFRQMDIEIDPTADAIRLVNRDFTGEGSTPEEAEIYFEKPSGALHAAYPVFPDSKEASRSGLLSDVDRRGELASWVARSDVLPASTVNRVWKQFLGFGLGGPLGDIDSSAAAQPELLDGLAEQFAAHDYNVKSVMRWVAMSDAFALSSDVSLGALADTPETGGRPLFSRFYQPELQREAVGDSLMLAAKMKSGEAFSAREQARIDSLERFTRNLGSGGNSIIATDPLATFAIKDRSGLLDRIAQSKLSTMQKIEHLFQAALGRQPTSIELARAEKLIGDGQAKDLKVIWWALLNSNE